MKAYTSTLAVLAGLLTLLPLAHAQWDALELRSIDEALDYAHFLKRELSDTHAYIRSERDAYEEVLARASSSVTDYDDLFARAGPYRCQNSGSAGCKDCICTTTADPNGPIPKTCMIPTNTRLFEKGTWRNNPTCSPSCKCTITPAEKQRMIQDEMQVDRVVNKTPVSPKPKGRK